MVVNPRMEELNCDVEREHLMAQYITFKRLYEKYSPIVKDILRMYSCEMCGKCCREERVLLREKDVNKLEKFSGDKFADYVERYFGKSVYLKLPCPYLEEREIKEIKEIKEENGKCKCRINHIKPNVCSNYPFIFLYGYFISLAFCPYGNKIIKDMFEFNKECGINVEEEMSDNKMSEIVKDIDNMYDKIGMKNDTSSKILNMPFDYLVAFHKWIKKKRRDKKGGK